MNIRLMIKYGLFPVYTDFIPDASINGLRFEQILFLFSFKCLFIDFRKALNVQCVEVIYENRNGILRK